MNDEARIRITSLELELRSLRASCEGLEQHAREATERYLDLCALINEEHKLKERLKLLEASYDEACSERDLFREENILLLTQKEGAVEALEQLLISHFNLYKSTFGELTDPNNDIVRLEALKSLEELKK